MARDIQPASSRAGASVRAFVAALVAAIFWIILAVVFPTRLVPRLVPELAPFAQWVPAIFYALAIWGFVRAARSLQRVAAGRPRLSVSSRPTHLGRAKPAAEDRGMPIIERKPTVQRMR